jgi:hypothetical protein
VAFGSVEVDGRGQHGRPAAEAQGHRAGGQGGALAEEGHLGPVPHQVPVAQQAHDAVVPQGAQHGATDAGAEGQDLHAEAGPEVGEPLEQLGGLEGLDHHGDRVPLRAQPGTAVLPPAEVGQGEDDALAGGPPGLDVLEPVARHAREELPRRALGHPERLEPVAGVGGERAPHLPTQGRLPHLAVDPSQVARHHAAPAPQAGGQERGRGPGQRLGGRLREGAGQAGPDAVEADHGLRPGAFREGTGQSRGGD